jgi:pyruvate dehydrogenase E1 component alpha subunit
MSDTELYRVLAEDNASTPGYDPPLDDEQLLDAYRLMVQTRSFEAEVIRLHRQGRVSIYSSSEGEEALAIAAAMTLSEEDWLFPDYRVAGALFQRGVPMVEFLAQLFGTGRDVSKGRQIPTHYGCRRRRISSISSPVGNGIAHAVGFAWAARIKKGPEVVLTFFGDGATSEEGFHTGMNIAGIHKLPVVFVCRNNQYAISVPLSLQTGSETIAIKAKAYGFDGVRVDGTDALAVHKVVGEAVERARKGGGPTLVEGVTYRHGAHSTSDDDTRYREAREAEAWRRRDPIDRFQRYLRARRLWDDAKEATLQQSVAARVQEAVADAEAAPPPLLESLFDDVYQDLPWHLQEQRQDLVNHESRSRARES